MTDLPAGPELDRVCSHCGAEKAYKRRSRPYCSKQCYIASRWEMRQCARCGKLFRARLIYSARGQMIFCSTRCQAIASRKRDGTEYGGRWYSVNAHGYLSCGDKVLHRELWKEARGAIPTGMDIHHKDGDRLNNELSNLEMINHADHAAHHVGEHPRLPLRPKTWWAEQGCDRQAKARGLCTRHYQNRMAKIKGGWPRWVKA